MSLRLFLVCCLCVIAGCSSTDSQSSRPLQVKVFDWQGKAVPNATIVLGNQTGAVEAVSATDYRGETSFDSVPANATVAAAIKCTSSPSDRTYHYLDITYGVNGPAVALTLTNCEESDQWVNVAITETVPGITSRAATIGGITYGGSSAKIHFNSAQQSDGTISVLATGYDEMDTIIGYGFALDRPAVIGSTIDVVIDRTNPLRQTHRFAAVPSTTIGYTFSASLIRKHSYTWLPLNFSSGTAPLPATVDTYSFDGFADTHRFGCDLVLDADGDGTADATVGVSRSQRTPSGQVFDFSPAPLVPGNITFNPGAAGRPVISWSNNDPRSTVQTLTFDHRETEPQKRTFYYTLTVPASVASLVFPELPEELAAFRIGTYSGLSLTTMKFDGTVSYDRYLEAFFDNAGFFSDAEGLGSHSYAGISRVP
ncbi:MAG: hypothetical protein ACYC7J_19960 [Syntrophales bacterium]